MNKKEKKKICTFPLSFSSYFIYAFRFIKLKGNNVGRNAFRIFQVQRAFSDAHRALVASLEWDMYSAAGLNDGVGDYPLLKCLLQSEDVFYELDDNR